MTRRAEFVFSPASADDVPAVASIERMSFGDPWSAKAFGEIVGEDTVYFLCARRANANANADANAEGAVVGYVVAWFAADQGELANIAVHPDARGKGVGRALLDAALAEAARRGAVKVFLEVRESNLKARALYRSRHFEEIGRRRGYYNRPVEDAIVLRRTLTAL